MNSMSLRAWFGQVTTGAGAMVLAPALLALLAHQMTLAQAIPVLAAGVVGLIWPENKALAGAVESAAGAAVAAAPAAAASAEAIIGAYRAGLTHGMALAPASAPVASPAAGAPA